MTEQPAGLSAADDTRRRDEVSDLGDRANDAGKFLTPQTAVAVLVTLTYWVTVFVLPGPRPRAGQAATEPVVPESVPGLAIAAMVVLALAAVVLLLMGLLSKRLGGVATICLAGFLVLLDLLLLSAFYRWIPYTMQLKFAIGVGGAAIASFAFGIIVYDTLRVAASLPIVILVIGLATFPAGYSAGDDIRGQIILWMGGVLGIATVTEGITQAVRIRGSAAVRSEVVKVQPTDAEAIARMGRELTSDLAKIGGDLSPSMGAPAVNPGSSARSSGR